MQLQIINGPNLNLLGKREPEIYGNESFESYLPKLRLAFPGIQIAYFQSNHEGAIIDQLQTIGFSFDGIILNAAGLTHTSIALADTIAAIQTPVIEVHLSNIHAREDYRRHSYTAQKAKGIISGLGLDGYRLAIEYFIGHRP